MQAVKTLIAGQSLEQTIQANLGGVLKGAVGGVKAGFNLTQKHQEVEDVIQQFNQQQQAQVVPTQIVEEKEEVIQHQISIYNSSEICYDLVCPGM